MKGTKKGGKKYIRKKLKWLPPSLSTNIFNSWPPSLTFQKLIFPYLILIYEQIMKTGHSILISKNPLRVTQNNNIYISTIIK